MADRPPPPDEISTATGAALIGVSPRRLRQLADGGHVVIHRRGFTTVSSVVSGYIRSLRQDASASPTSAVAARGHAAKASLTRAATARRKALLTVRFEAEAVVQEVADAAIRRLRDAKLPTSIPMAAGRSFRSEIAQAIAQIEAAKARALAALVTGDLSLLDHIHGR